MPPKKSEETAPKVERELTGAATHIALMRGHAKAGEGYVLVERGEPVPAGNPVSTEWMAPKAEAAEALAETEE